MKKNILYIIMLLCVCSVASAQQIIRGRILSASDKAPLPGSSIKIKGNTSGTAADSAGNFVLHTQDLEIILQVSSLGYRSREVSIRLPAGFPLEIYLEENSSQLQEVIVSTGYQEIPKERATGSFAKVDNELLNRRTSTDILSRLEDVVPGLVFNRNVSGRENNISIRGQSTIFANAQPLIVLDNFPYDGDISNINPNDIESVTVLKDAAAASLWGSKAANGVIVISSKRGSYKKAPKVSFHANNTLGDKPNLFYQSRMSSADFIEIEKMLFAKGYYQSAELSTNKTPLTPVIELLIAKRDGKILSAAADEKIEALKGQDVRNDFDRYMNRMSINRQVSLSISGGSDNQRYFASAGYDYNTLNSRGNDYGRLTLNAKNTWSLFRNKLELSTGIYFAQNNNTLNNPGIPSIRMSNAAALYPYARLADDSGKPLAIIHDYRRAFLQSAEQQGLLNWEYKPLEEMSTANNMLKITDYRVNGALRYKIITGLNADVLYQYGGGLLDGRNLQSQESYYTRNMINQLTYVNTDGSISRPLPLGGIYDRRNGSSVSQNLRSQLNYSRLFAKQHSINAIAGWEVKDLHGISNTYRLYGYDPDHVSSAKVDYVNYYKRYDNPFSGTIMNNDSGSDQTDRFQSYYANAAYSFKQRYTLSASGRFDQSNLFGVRTNQKGVPLWSAGLAWDLSSENFYPFKCLPYLKIRATYGYNGNIDKALTAFTTAVYFNGSASSIGQPYAQITNPPNPELRWERVKIINLGVDFESRAGRVGGSIEYYRKKGLDLTGNIPYPPSSGISSFRGNNANTSGQGLDFTLNSRNFNREFKWLSNFLFSYVKDKVTNYLVQSTSGKYLEGGYGFSNYPLEGKPLYSIYSYSWAGLDPQTGDPMGYLDGAVSKDYAKILSAARPENLIYHGPARPTMFGALRNTFSYKNISISANVSYRLGYYFRNESIQYGTLLSGQVDHGDYSLRWQKPGDETFTHVPSIPAVTNTNRDNLYLYSDALVEKGDHIRLQDIQLSYDLERKDHPRFPLARTQFYLYANNLGILWKAGKGSIDPDHQTGLVPLTISAGLRVNF